MQLIWWQIQNQSQKKAMSRKINTLKVFLSVKEKHSMNSLFPIFVYIWSLFVSRSIQAWWIFNTFSSNEKYHPACPYFLVVTTPPLTLRFTNHEVWCFCHRWAGMRPGPVFHVAVFSARAVCLGARALAPRQCWQHGWGRTWGRTRGSAGRSHRRRSSRRGR